MCPDTRPSLGEIPMTQLKPCLRATGVGSIPEPDPGQGLDFVFSHMPHIPFWPQLPKRSVKEDMVLQFCPHLPFVEIDWQKRKAALTQTVDFGVALAELYAQIEEGRLEAFGLSKENAPAFFLMKEKILAMARKPECLKGHVTGPLTMGNAIWDAPDASGLPAKRVLYNSEIMTLLPEALGMMGAWQAHELGALADQVIIFLDEPVLSGYGAGAHAVALNEADVKDMLNRTVDVIQKYGSIRANVIVGLHCCGDSTWEHWLDTRIDIINFDAYAYWESFATRAREIQAFLDRGGVVAFGIVPTDPAKLQQETADSLWRKFKDQIQTLIDQGIDRTRLIEQTLLTPACGFGSRDMTSYTNGFAMLQAVSQTARDHFGL
jgi:hypothetical protein